MKQWDPSDLIKEVLELLAVPAEEVIATVGPARVEYSEEYTRARGRLVFRLRRALKHYTRGSYEACLPCCPSCGTLDRLVVCEVTLVATGETLEVAARLHEDGFAIELPEGAGTDGSTEEVQVLCLACTHRFPLAEVQLDD